jgi:cysteine desulfurase/selenocysteine lyase
MSTSEQSLVTPAIPEVNSTGPALAGSSALPGSAGIAPGDLSPAELARMANAMFNALPDEMQQPGNTAARFVLPANSAFSGNPYAAVPSPTAPAVPGILAGLAELQPAGFVATPDHCVPPDARSSASVPAAPVSSQTGRGAAAPNDPAFAFLADARPLFVPPSAEPAPLWCGEHAPRYAGSLQHLRRD